MVAISKPNTWIERVLIIVVLGLGVLGSVYVSKEVGAAQRESLRERAQTIAEALPEESVASLLGDTPVLEQSEYYGLKEKFKALLEVNRDARFVYLTGKRDGKIFFLVDSEDSESPDYSPPGQEYKEASTDFHRVFDEGVSLVEGPISDRWGKWISAMAPVTYPGDQVVAVVGIDIDAQAYKQTIFTYASIPFLIAIFFALLISLVRQSHKVEHALIGLKSELNTVASHDLRSPLVGIRWSLESLLKSGTVPQSIETELAKIRQAAETLLDTIQNILDTELIEQSKGAILKKEPANLKALIKEAADTLEFLSRERGVPIEIDQSIPDNLMVSCSPKQMRRVFANLLSNALKYSPENESVTVGYQKWGRMHMVAIIDHGIGIPEEEQDKIFTQFYRTKAAAQSKLPGTGLGLYYAKEVVERHGGTLRFESDAGKGTTFFVELPME